MNDRELLRAFCASLLFDGKSDWCSTLVLASVGLAEDGDGETIERIEAPGDYEIEDAITAFLERQKEQP